jgi:hypothetical protein
MPASVSWKDLEGLPLIRLARKQPFSEPPKNGCVTVVAKAGDVMAIELRIWEKTK